VFSISNCNYAVHSKLAELCHQHRTDLVGTWSASGCVARKFNINQWESFDYTIYRQKYTKIQSYIYVELYLFTLQRMQRVLYIKNLYGDPTYWKSTIWRNA